MARKRHIELSDIQDETDIYDRLVLKQRKSKKKFPPEKVSSALLSDKVRLVEEKRKGRLSLLQNSVDSESDGGNDVINGVSDDEMPAIVESRELQQEKSVHFIPNVRNICKGIIERYDELALNVIFRDAEQNHMFRLFVSAASFGLLDLLKFSQEELTLYVSVLRDIASKQKAKKIMKDRFARARVAYTAETDSYATETDSNDSQTMETAKTSLDSGHRTIIRSSEPFKVTKRITQLLDEANVR